MGAPVANSPRVLVEGLVFGNAHQRGIQRYIVELLKRVQTPFSILLGGPPACSLNPDWPVLQRREYGARPQFNFIKRGYHSLRRRSPPRALRSFDLFHSTYFQPPPDSKRPCVVVVYDMVCELIPQHFDGDAAGEAARRHRAIQRADAIITISESTRRDLIQVYPEFAAKATAIPLGAEHLLHSVPPETPVRSSPPFALYVGDRSGYKNFNTLLESMKEQDWPSDLVLKVAGQPFSEAENARIRSCRLGTRIEHCGRPADAALAALYQTAAVFVFPSLLEGFGFPLLEAHGLGAPVAASGTPVFHEVGGQAFEPFDPLDPASLAAAVSRAGDPVRAGHLRALGFQNVRRFSWETTAKATVDVWRDCH